MGYSVSDNLIYGVLGRSAVDGTKTLRYPYSYSFNSAVGDCDNNGHYYSPNGNEFYCVDVDPYRTTYLRPLDPYNSFAEVFTTPYRMTYTGGYLNSLADWSYVQSVNSIIGQRTSTNQLWILSLTTPLSYLVPIVGSPVSHTGISFSDLKNFYYPTGSQIAKIEVFTTIAYASALSSSSQTIGGDGCRAGSAPVFYAQPLVVKNVDKPITDESDTLFYTVTIVNTGITDGLTTTFMDTLPDGTSFIPGTFNFNGVNQPAATPNNFDIGSLPIGEVYTITFSADITSGTIPELINFADVQTTYYDSATNDIFDTTFTSNNAVTTIVANNLTALKTVDKSFSILGAVINYEIILENIGVNTFVDTYLTDTVPAGTSFISNSLSVDGVSIPSTDLYPPGYNIGTIAAGEVVTVNFAVSLDSIVNDVTDYINLGEINYNAVLSIGNFPFNTDTNTVVTSLRFASFDSIVKNVDKSFSTNGGTIQYTFNIPNTGTVEATNVTLIDTIPNGLEYVPGTLELDGVPTAGSPDNINLGTILPNDSITVTYIMKVL